MEGWTFLKKRKINFDGNCNWNVRNIAPLVYALSSSKFTAFLDSLRRVLERLLPKDLVDWKSQNCFTALCRWGGICFGFLHQTVNFCTHWGSLCEVDKTRVKPFLRPWSLHKQDWLLPPGSGWIAALWRSSSILWCCSLVRLRVVWTGGLVQHCIGLFLWIRPWAGRHMKYSPMAVFWGTTTHPHISGL